MSVGQHVTLVTTDGKTFSGSLINTNDQIGKVVLNNVTTDGRRLSDRQTFFVTDIKDFAFTDSCMTRSNDADSLLDHVKRATGKFVSRRNVPLHLARAPVFNGDRMLLSHIAREEDGDDQGIGSGDDVDNYEDYYDTDDYLLLCRSCEKSREAIVYLMEQEYVSAVFCGVEMGRKGTVSIIQIATKEYVFIFDMLRLGSEGFIDGLQELLESQHVLKIVHDCRMVSDLLYHQYNVVLSNVFDTQVAAAFSYRDSNEGDWPRSVENLPTALMNHLFLSEDDVHIAFVRERSRTIDEEVWLQRPLSKHLLLCTLKNLRKLIPLYHYMSENLMLSFKIGVEIYLRQVRDAPDGIVAKHKISGHLLPHAFQDLEKRVASTSREFILNQHRPKTYDHKGFKENKVRTGPLTSSKVITSRDSIWHSAEGGFASPGSKKTDFKAPKGIPPEEVYARKENRIKAAGHVLSERKNEDNKRLLSDSSHSIPQFSEIEAVPTQTYSNTSTHSLLDQSDSSTVGLPKSISPINNSDHAPSPTCGSGISRSALFQLSQSPSHRNDLSRGIDSDADLMKSITSSSSIGRPNSKHNGSPVTKSYSEIQSVGVESFDNSINSDEYFSFSSENERNSPKVSKQKGLAESSLPEDEASLIYDQKWKSKVSSERKTSDEISHSEEDEGNTSPYDRIRNAEVSLERSFDTMNLLPAGHHACYANRRRGNRNDGHRQFGMSVSESHSSSRSNPMQQQHNDDWEEELGTIPMHRSLNRSTSKKKTELNSSDDVYLGDPCDAGSMPAKSSTPKSFLSRLNINNNIPPKCEPVVVSLFSGTEDDDLEEDLVDEILKLEEVKRILRVTKSGKPSRDIRSKLLSSKIKL